MERKKEGQVPPPPRLLLDGHLQVRAINACLRRICNIGAGALRGVPVEEWVNAEAELLARIRVGLSRCSPPWHEVLRLRLPGNAAVFTQLKLMPLRGRRGPGLLVTVEEIRMSEGSTTAVTLAA